MNFITSARIILIGIILITASGCKQNGADSSAANVNPQEEIKLGIVDQVDEPEDFSKIPDDEQSLFDIEEQENPEFNDNFESNEDSELDENPESDDNSNPVPEPLTVLLLGPALIGLLALKKREKHAS